MAGRKEKRREEKRREEERGKERGGRKHQGERRKSTNTPSKNINLKAGVALGKKRKRESQNLREEMSVIVIKIGSSSLMSLETGHVALANFSRLVEEVMNLKRKGYQVFLLIFPSLN